MQNILSWHKEYYAYISKLGKNIDKNFNQEINEAFEPVEMNNDLLKAVRTFIVWLEIKKKLSSFRNI